MIANRTCEAGSELATLIESNDLTVIPGVHDVLSALLAEEVGFGAVLVGSHATNACAFGLPDIGIVSVSELIQHGQRIIDSVSIPVILDLDDCGGTPLTIRRNVQLAARAGAAAIQIEDIELARGKHFADRPHNVMPLERAVENVRAAAAAREGSDMLIIARTDVLLSGTLDEAIKRVNAFAEAGADVALIWPLAISDIRRAATAVPIPLLNTFVRDLSRVDQIAQARVDGLRLIVPASLTMRAAYAAVQEGLTELRENERDQTLQAWARVASEVDVTVGVEDWATHVQRQLDTELPTYSSSDGPIARHNHQSASAQPCPTDKSRSRPTASTGSPTMSFVRQSVPGPGQRFSNLLDVNELTVVPGVYDVLSALVAEERGFEAVYVGGYAVASCAFGLPDSGVLSVAELIEYGRRIIDAVSIPVVLDIDDGGGTPLRIHRNVQLAARAGAAAIQIEDIDLSRGKHFAGRPHEVLPLDRAVENVHAAAAARDGSDMLIIARTDVLFTGSLDEAIERVNAFGEAGADIAFICMLPPADIRRAAEAVSRPLLNLYIRDESRVDQIAQARADGLRVIIPTSLTFRAAYAAVRQVLTELKDTEQDPTVNVWAEVATDLDRTVRIEQWARALQ